MAAGVGSSVRQPAEPTLQGLHQRVYALEEALVATTRYASSLSESLHGYYGLLHNVMNIISRMDVQTPRETNQSLDVLHRSLEELQLNVAHQQSAIHHHQTPTPSVPGSLATSPRLLPQFDSAARMQEAVGPMDRPFARTQSHPHLSSGAAMGHPSEVAPSLSSSSGAITPHSKGPMTPYTGESALHASWSGGDVNYAGRSHADLSEDASARSEPPSRTGSSRHMSVLGLLNHEDGPSGGTRMPRVDDEEFDDDDCAMSDKKRKFF